MKCPACNTDMKITSNKLVERPDGTIARRLRLTCVSKRCENYNKVVQTLYIPQEVVKEDPA